MPETALISGMKEGPGLCFLFSETAATLPASGFFALPRFFLKKEWKSGQNFEFCGPILNDL